VISSALCKLRRNRFKIDKNTFLVKVFFL
jgi:hypothetical protein